MNVRNAAVQVLQEAGEPLHAKEIAKALAVLRKGGAG